MSRTPMKLILTQEVTGLGAPGDVVEVAGGYGRNYLVPRGLAMRWTRGAEKQIDLIKRAREAHDISGLDDVGAADVVGLTGPLDQVDLLLGPARPPHGEPARHQVVAAVPAGHLHHVTGSAQTGDLLGEDELHRRATHGVNPLARPSGGCWCTAASPFHGRS